MNFPQEDCDRPPCASRVLLGQHLFALDPLDVSHQIWEAVGEASLLRTEVIFSKKTQVETFADKKGAGAL